MRAPLTLGEACEQGGYAEAMIKIAELAQAVGRMPAGEWDYRFTTDPRWRICLNGGPHDTWTPPEAMAVPRFHAYLEYHGMPAGLINPADGTMLVGAEAQFVAAIAIEIAKGPASWSTTSARSSKERTTI